MSQKFKKAELGKRFAAWILDNLLIITLVVGCCVSMADWLGYDANNQALDEVFTKYETQYGVTFDLTEEDYLAMSEAEQKNYDEAYEALSQDPQALETYGRMMGLTLTIAAVSFLLPLLIWEFVIPLCLGKGQTLGKKVFSLAVVQKNFAYITPMQLLMRTLVGKYAIETMVPLSILLMVFWGSISMSGVMIFLVLAAGQIACVALTRNHSAIHDLVSGTQVVDRSSLVIQAE